MKAVKDLAANESCFPDRHQGTEAIINTISHAIMRRLRMCIIPKTNTGMLEILGPYTKDRNGVWCAVCSYEKNMLIHEANHSRMGNGMVTNNKSEQVRNRVTIMGIRV
jgi:hypothetical protein